MRQVNSSYIVNSTNISSLEGTLFDEVSVGNTIHSLLKTEVALYIYAFIIFFAMFLTFTRSFLFFKLAMMSSKNLHARMFHCLLLAPMKFFNTNPSGRILNRFSKDIGAIDEILPRVLLDATQVC